MLARGGMASFFNFQIFFLFLFMKPSFKFMVSIIRHPPVLSFVIKSAMFRILRNNDKFVAELQKISEVWPASPWDKSLPQGSLYKHHAVLARWQYN